MSATKKPKKKPAVNSKGRGVRIDEKIKSKAMVLLAYDNTVSFVCSKLGLKESTVRTWEKALKNNAEFAEFRDKYIKERRNQYLIEACECLGTAIKVLHKKLDNAIACENKRGELIDKLSKCNDKDKDEKLTADELKKAITLFLPESLGDIARAFSLLTEKVALMSGEATQNINHSGNVKFEDL